MPKQLLSLGGDGGGARGTGTALASLAASPVYEPIIREMTTEVMQKLLADWSANFQSGAAVLLSAAIMLVGNFALVKLAHHSRGTGDGAA